MRTNGSLSISSWNSPLGAILDWTMGTPAGFAAYRDPRPVAGTIVRSPRPEHQPPANGTRSFKLTFEGNHHS
jgi:hypothetical protein